MKKQKKEALIGKEIELNKADKRLAQKIKKIQQAKNLTARLQKIHEWWPVYQAEHPDTSLGETVKTMQKTIKKLLGKNVSLNKKKKKQPLQSDIEEKFYSFRRYMMRRNQIISPQQQEDFNFPGPVLIPWLSDLSGPFCEITSGVARANASTVYNWNLPDRSDTYSTLIFTPRSGLDETNFEGKFIAGKSDNISIAGLARDIGDSRGTFYVLRVPFPQQSRNVMIFYETIAIVRLVEGCTVFNPWPEWWSHGLGYLDLEYVIHEQPNGGIFPSFSMFEKYPGIVCGETNLNDTLKMKTFFGSMQVRADTKSNLYIGASIRFSGKEDEIVTTGPKENPGGGRFTIVPPDWASKPRQDLGVYYVMVPIN
jgi:hypothetical protein